MALRLRTRAEPVAEVDGKVRKLIDDLFETMYKAPGIGLAATQVNVHLRVLVVDTTEDRSHPLALVNPRIIERSGEGKLEEGCLSVPGIYETVKRADRIRVQALDRNGRLQDFEAEGLLAVCIQHEMDHLEGKLFVDYLSELKRTRIRKKLEKDLKNREGSGADRSRAPAI
jgi:peptide deformylase